MISISQILCCYGNLVTWEPKRNQSNSFVLSCIEFIFGMELPWDDKHQPNTSLLW